MSLSGNDRFNFIVGMQFQPGDAVGEALRTSEAMRDAFAQVLGKPLSITDILNNTQALQEAQKLASQMREKMEVELQKGLSTRLESSGLKPSTQQAVLSAAGPDQTTYGLKQALRKYETQLRLEAQHLANTGDEDDAKGAAKRRAEAALISAYRADVTAAEAQEKSMADLARANIKFAEVMQKAAGVAAENARANASAGTFRPEYANPNVATGLGAAQANVNQALRRRIIAEEQHTALMARDDKTLIQVQQSEARLASATTSLEAARRRAQIAEIKAAPVPPTRNFASQFGLGFKGETERPYAEQLGQAFKFSLFYGTAYKLLFALTQTFQQTLQEGIAFQQAVSELKLASGRADDSMNDLANNLGDQAVQAGQAPSTGVLIGARSLGLYGATRAPEDVQARVAQESAQVVSKLAFTSGQAADELQTNVAAIVNAFGGGAGAQFRVGDIDAYMAQRFGVAPGATIQAVSEAGTVGAAAGFNQEEVNAIAAALMARTGQTAPAVAGFMAQIFSRGGEGSLTSVSSRYGIDPTAELSTQIKELSRVYKTASPQERAQLSAAFGRGKVQNAAIALLQSFPEVEAAATDARAGGSTGKLDQAFNVRMDNIGGQIQLTTAVLKEFANQLGQSGLLNVLGGAVIVLRDLVEAGTGLLKLWNEMPGAMKATIVGLALLTAASRTAAAAALLGGRVGSLGLFRSAGGAYGAGAPIAAGRLAVATEAGAVAPLASRAGAGAIAAAAAPLAAAGAALATIFVAGMTKTAADKLDATQASTPGLLAKGLDPTAGSDALLARSAELDASAKDAERAAHGFFAHIVDLGQASARDADLASQATSEAARLRVLAAAQARQEAADAARPKPLITGFDSESLTSSLDAITSSGGTAKERLDALTAALTASGDAAQAATESFNASLFAGKGAQSIQEKLAASPLFVGQTSPKGGGAFGSRLAGFRSLAGIALPNLAPGKETTNALPDALRAALSPEEIQKRLQDALSKQGVTSLADINPQVAGSLAETVVGTTPEEVLKNLGIKDPASIGRVRAGYVGIIKRWLLLQSKSVRDIVTGHLALSPAELDATVDRIGTDTQELLSTLGSTDTSGRISALRRQVRLIRAAIARSPEGSTPQSTQELNAARIALSNQQIDELENLRRAAQQNARGKAQIAARGRSFLTRILRNAIQAGNQDRLVAVIQTAGKYGIAIAQQAVNEAIKVARAAIAMATEINSASNALLADATIAGQAAAAGPRADLAKYKKLQNVIKNTMHGNASTDNYLTGADANLPADAAAADSGPTARQIAAARQSALAQGSESQISQARAAIASARADMAAAKKGTVEYYSALGAYLSARNELTDAIQAYRQNLFLLHHDITNPLTQARAETRAAAQKLRSDAGKPGDVRAADRVALQQAQASQEATAFSQRLETVQTAEQLGRVSHATYIRYLENESRRLNRIKDRTFQQQQQLNQIDGLLQDAAKEMEGQFNIAGIKLPTVYQVRRAIAERSGPDGPARSQIAGTARGQVNSNNTTYIRIDGADFTKVKRLVTDELAKPGRVVTGAPRRRV